MSDNPIATVVESAQLILDELGKLPGRTAKVLCCELALISPLVKMQTELRDGKVLHAALEFAKVLLQAIPYHLEHDTCETSVDTK